MTNAKSVDQEIKYIFLIGTYGIKYTRGNDN